MFQFDIRVERLVRDVSRPRSMRTDMRKGRQGNMIRLPILIAPRREAFVKKLTPIPCIVAKSPTPRRRYPRHGATALEYAFVAFLLLIIVSLLSMGLLRARESARDQLCLRRLVLLAKAVDDFEATEGAFPGYASPSRTAQSNAISWVASTLPYLDERLPVLQPTSEGWKIREQNPAEPQPEPKKRWPDWKRALSEPIAQLICPAEDSSRLRKPAAASYVANCGYPDAPEGNENPDYAANGIFLDLRRASPLTMETVQNRDGSDFTLLLSENVQSGNWDSLEESKVGFVWTERIAKQQLPKEFSIPEILAVNQGLHLSPNGYKTARPSSRHRGAVHAAFANTRLSRIASDIDPVVYIRLCTVDDTQLINPWTEKPIGPPIGRDKAQPGASSSESSEKK